MTRKTALKTFFAILASRAVAVENDTLTFADSKFLAIPEEMTYVFNLKRIKLEIDGRTVTFTAKELADALDAK